MKAVLDHVGIAVDRLDEALAFYRDALGLDVDLPEDVPTQKVRAHMVDTGAAALELLEATAPASPIATFIGRRGPGLHHVTLRVENLQAALAHLAARGVRLVDSAPRTGAHGSLVAFIHPSAAHGVLVELKQSAPPAVRLGTAALAWGDLSLTVLHDGPFRLDGGAMFGVVPKPLWEKLAPADDRNRIQLAMRPLLVEASWGRMLVDCGVGEKMPEKARDIYALDRTVHLDHALAERGLEVASIDAVLATHLHFDHFGGATARGAQGLVPRFPKARYLIRDTEWEDATHPHERNRASYLQDDFVPLKPAGVIDFYSGDVTVKPGVRVVRTGGHTGQHQIVYLESAGKTAVFTADLIPTTAHLQDPWVMGYDLFPMETLAVKKRFIREAIDREYLIFFEHDPLVAAGIIRERDGKRWVEQVL
ncbi:MAG TPA: methylmalonyl-CoA epimerase [Vicinamibacterales bacterium]|jgi:methylmalonyl-CoA epimerase|nr:methylmalonyl-CoA epimerase [Vicinamibacterales bacterium]